MATYRLTCFPDSRSWWQSAVLNRAFFAPRFTLKNRPAECPESYQPRLIRGKLLSCSDFSESTCVTSDF